MPLNYPQELILSFIIRSLFAALFGGIIGTERGLRFKEAGFRTHCVVAVTSAAMMLVSAYGFPHAGEDFDPAQIACQIVLGINIWGAGMIYKDETSGISGLSSAGGLWATCAIGMACGCNMIRFSAIVTALILILHWILNKTNVDQNVYSTRTVRLEVVDVPYVRRLLRYLKQDYGIKVEACSYTRHEDRGTVTLSFRIRMRGQVPFRQVLKIIDSYDEIKEISI